MSCFPQKAPYHRQTPCASATVRMNQNEFLSKLENFDNGQLSQNKVDDKEQWRLGISPRRPLDGINDGEISPLHLIAINTMVTHLIIKQINQSRNLNL